MDEVVEDASANDVSAEKSPIVVFYIEFPDQDANFHIDIKSSQPSQKTCP